MQSEDLELLFAYNRWGNVRVLRACQELAIEDLRASAPCSFGSLLGTLAHIYAAERAWRLRLQEGVSPGALPTAADFPTLAALESAWEAEQRAMAAFISALGAADLDRWVEYTTTAGQAQGSRLWKALVHVVMHGVQFRAEAGAALAVLGRSPGDLDFILYLRESDQR